MEVEDKGGEDDKEEGRMVDKDAEGKVPGTMYNKAIKVIGGNRIGTLEAYPQEEKVQFSRDKVFPGIKLYLHMATNWHIVDEKGNNSMIMTKGKKPDYIDQPNWDDLVRDHQAFKMVYPGMLDQQPLAVEEYDWQVYAAKLALQYALLQLQQVTHLNDQDQKKIMQLKRYGTRDPKFWRQQQEWIKKVEELEKKIESTNIMWEEAQNHINF
ncbi:hypothetical protein FRC11_000594, partial [Ceratobasidium sp. 423]